MTSPARYIMIGGFLGAGKTTAVAALAKHLSDLGQRVGLITNDQGRELVDTRMLQLKGNRFLDPAAIASPSARGWRGFN